MKKAWKIGISTITGIVGACVLIRIHNAEVRKVYCERYGKGYDEGYDIAKQEAHNKLVNAIKKAISLGNSIQETAEIFEISESEVEKYLNQ